MSIDDGAYAKWLTNTTDVSGIFSGEEGKTYAFYSVARDQTGNIEESPESPDTTTIIRTPCEGDHEPDGDVDGSDLAHLANPNGIDLQVFAEDFGRASCQ